MMTVFPEVIKVQSTSKVSLNDRFTSLMKTRKSQAKKPSHEPSRENVQSSRRSRLVERLPPRRNSPPRYRQNIHNRVGPKNFPGRIRKRYSFWDRERKAPRRTFPRSRTPYYKFRSGHPLDRVQKPQSGRPHNFRYRKPQHTDKYGRFKQMRVNRRGLDRDMDEYMNKSSKYNREKLDQDMEYYMSKSKGYLDKSIDEYMTNAKKFRPKRAETLTH